MAEWKRGLPPGKYYVGMVEDYEVCFTAGGLKWPRRRSEDEKQAWIALKARNAKALSSHNRGGHPSTDR